MDFRLEATGNAVHEIILQKAMWSRLNWAWSVVSKEVVLFIGDRGTDVNNLRGNRDRRKKVILLHMAG
jgi:hypothetical protein